MESHQTVSAWIKLTTCTKLFSDWNTTVLDVKVTYLSLRLSFKCYRPLIDGGHLSLLLQKFPYQEPITRPIAISPCPTLPSATFHWFQIPRGRCQTTHKSKLIGKIQNVGVLLYISSKAPLFKCRWLPGGKWKTAEKDRIGSLWGKFWYKGRDSFILWKHNVFVVEV